MCIVITCSGVLLVWCSGVFLFWCSGVLLIALSGVLLFGVFMFGERVFYSSYTLMNGFYIPIKATVKVAIER